MHCLLSFRSPCTFMQEVSPVRINQRYLQMLCIIVFFLFSMPPHGMPHVVAIPAIQVSPSDIGWKALIESAAPGSVFSFQPGIYHACGIALNRSGLESLVCLRIFSGGTQKVMIQMSPGRHFSLAGRVRNVRLVALALLNGQADGEGGGCIHMAPDTGLELLNVTLRGCKASGEGGAVLVGKNSKLVVKDSSFSSCSASRGGGGLHLDLSSSSNIANSNFSDCTADTGGAVVLNGGASLTMTDVSMYHNFATSRGGGIDAGGDGENSVVIHGGNFVGNTVASAALGSLSGFYTTREAETKKTVTRQHTHSAETALTDRRSAETTDEIVPPRRLRRSPHASQTDAHVSSQTNRHLREQSEGSYGGLVSLWPSSQLVMRDSLVSSSVSSMYGGAVYAREHSSVLLQNVSIRGGVAGVRGAALYMFTSNLSALASTFEGNTAGERAAIVGWESSFLRFRGCHVSSNSAGFSGGGIYVMNSALTVTDSSIDGNEAGARGTVWKEVDEKPESGEEFENEQLKAAFRQKRVLVFSMSELKQYGVLDTIYDVYLRVDSYIQIDNKYFQPGNAEGGSGGGILSYQSTVNLAGTVVTGNRARGRENGGGGLSIWMKSQLETYNTTIMGNKIVCDSSESKCISGGGYGGGVDVYSPIASDEYRNNTIAKFNEGTIVSNNEAGFGGGACVWYAKIFAFHAVFDSNKALEGGAFYASGRGAGGDIVLAETSVRRNIATGLLGGGGINLAMSSTLFINGDSTVSGNEARRLAGGLFLSSSSLRISSGALKILNNTAGTNGGGCMMREGSTMGEQMIQSSGHEGKTKGLYAPRSLIVAGNVALLGDGGGIALMGSSRILLFHTESIISDNVAGVAQAGEGKLSSTNRGGGLFVNATSRDGVSSSSSGDSAVVFWRLHLTGNRALGDGGGLFSYSQIELLARGFTKATDNIAARGGAVALADATLMTQPGHTIAMRGNTALTHGGALALLSGARVLPLQEEDCPAACSPEDRGDGYCDPSCLLRGCNYDNGDCIRQRMDKAGESSREACDVSQCSVFTLLHYNPDFCNGGCFQAACDWSRLTCPDARLNSKSCPLIDASVFASIRAELQHMPVFLTGGNSRGFGRCSGKCREPSQAPTITSMLATGLIGSSSLQLVPDSGDGQHRGQGWLHASLHKVKADDGMRGGTIEMWVKVPSVCEHGGGNFGFLFANAVMTISLVQANFSRSQFWPIVFWTGAPARRCSTSTILTASTGSIGDGPGDIQREGDVYTCSWILAPAGGFRVFLFFTEFMLTYGAAGQKDLLKIYSCDDILCGTMSEAITYSGVTLPPLYVSTTPVVLVQLVQMDTGSPTSPGFTASYASMPFTQSLPIGVWHHVAVSISVSGLVNMYINGTLWNRMPFKLSPPQRSPVLDGHHDIAIGRGAPDWQEGGDLGFGEACMAIDELRVWTSERSALNISENMRSGCGDLNHLHLAACYSFDEAPMSEEGLNDFFKDSSSNHIHAFAANYSSPYRSWCINKDHNGELQLSEHGDFSKTQMWGYCTTKPRLPGAGFDYEETEMEQVAMRRLAGTAAVLQDYPGCGEVPMLLQHNTAGDLGGAIYYDSCFRLESKCFLQGFDASSGSRAVLFHGNKAKGGGAIYVQCEDIGRRCEETFDGKNKLGVLPLLAKAEFMGNMALLFGNDIATRPASMRVNTSGLELAPGIEPLVMTVEIFDFFRNPVMGSDDIVEVIICKDDTGCSSASASAAVSNHRFVSGISEVEETFQCAEGQEVASYQVRIVGASHISAYSGLIHCKSCPIGHRRWLRRNQDDKTTWECLPCLPTTYIIDQDGPCLPCPVGGICLQKNGTQFLPRTAGSIWEEVQTETSSSTWRRIRLFECPVSYALLRKEDSPEKDECVACPGTDENGYSLRRAIWNGNESETGVDYFCEECPRPRSSASCSMTSNGVTVVSAEPGWWLVREETQEANRRGSLQIKHTYRTYMCDPGVCLGNNTCVEGRYGVLCGACRIGYTWQPGGCQACPQVSHENMLIWRPIFFVIFSLIVALVWYYKCWRPLFGSPKQLKDSSAGVLDRSFRACRQLAEKAGLSTSRSEPEEKVDHFFSDPQNVKLVQQYSKVLIAMVQVLAAFGSFKAPWPSSLGSCLGWAMSISGLLQIDLMALPGFSCFWSDYTFADKTYVKFLLPIVVVLLLWIPVLVAWIKVRSNHAQNDTGSQAQGTTNWRRRYEETLDQFWNSFLFWVFLIYPGTSLLSFQPFICTRIHNQTYLPAAEYKEECPWGGDSLEIHRLHTWSTLPVVSLIFMFVYPFGVPALMYFLLHAHGVPRLARKKISSALVRSMMGRFRKDTSSSSSQRLGAFIGLPPCMEKVITSKEEDANLGQEFERRTVELYSEIFPAHQRCGDLCLGHQLPNMPLKFLQALGYPVDMTALKLATKQWFSRVDSDLSGLIDINELEAEFLRYGLSEEEAKDTMAYFDADKNSGLDQNEFINMMHHVLGNSHPVLSAVDMVSLAHLFKKHGRGDDHNPCDTRETCPQDTPRDGNGTSMPSPITFEEFHGLAMKLVHNVFALIESESVDGLDIWQLDVLRRHSWGRKVKFNTSNLAKNELKQIATALMMLSLRIFPKDQDLCKRAESLSDGNQNVSDDLVHFIITLKAMIRKRRFDILNEDGCRLVTFEDFKRIPSNQGVSDSRLREIFDAIDVDQDGKLSFEEFSLYRPPDVASPDTTSRTSIQKCNSKESSKRTLAYVLFDDPPLDISESRIIIEVERMEAKLRKLLLQQVTDMALELEKEGIISAPPLKWDGSVGPEEEKVIARLGFLLDAYTVQAYWWEIVEMMRKLLLTVVLTAFYHGSPAQIGGSIVTIFFFLIGHQHVKPYLVQGLNTFQKLVLVSQFLTVFASLMFVIEEEDIVQSSVEDRDQTGREVVSILVIMINVAAGGIYPVYIFCKAFATSRHGENLSKGIVRARSVLLNRFSGREAQCGDDNANPNQQPGPAGGSNSGFDFGSAPESELNPSVSGLEMETSPKPVVIASGGPLEVSIDELDTMQMARTQNEEMAEVDRHEQAPASIQVRDIPLVFLPSSPTAGEEEEAESETEGLA